MKRLFVWLFEGLFDRLTAHMGRQGFILYGGGGGGTQTSTGTTYTSNIPEYAQAPFMNLVGKAEAISNQPYQPFTGQRIQGFTPLQQQAQTGAANQGVAGQIGAASGLAGVASMQGLNAAGYQPQQVNTRVDPNQVSTQSFLQGNNAGAYMSPYMQNVVAAQQRDASRQAGIAGTQRAAEFTKAGAFGGSRQAIMDAEAARNLALQQGDIQAKGLQSAYDAATGQFNQDQTRSLTAQQANQGAGLDAARVRMQGETANQGAGLDAQKLGLSGAGVALQGAQALGQLGQMQFGQQMDTIGLQDKMGQQQQAQGQKQLDQQYSDFQQQRDYPYQQLGFMSDILRGTAGSSRTMYSSQPTAGGLQNLAGLGALAGAFFRGGSVGYASGGIVKGYAAGGMVEPLALPARLRTMSDQQLAQFTQQHGEDLFSMALAKSESDARARMRQAGAPAEAPQGTVMDEVAAEMDPMTQGGIAAAVPDMDFADGGIVGYADGGPTRYPGLIQYEGAGDTLLPRTTGYEGMGVLEALSAMGVDIGDWAKRKGLTGSLQDKVADKKDFGKLGETENLASRYPAPAGLEAALPPEDAPDAPAPQPTNPQAGNDRTSVSASGRTGTSVAGTPRAGLAGAPVFDVKAIMDPLQKGLTEAQAADRAAAEADRADFEKDVAARGKAGEGREARIKAEQAGMAGSEEKARKAAFLQAGLAILTADPSRGGLAAIAEGAGKGVSQYRGDIEKLEAKRGVLLDKLDQIDDLRRQEANATATERRAIASRIRGLTGAAVREQVELAKSVGIPLTTAAAKMSQDRYLAELDRSTKLQAARISASSGGGRPNATLENAMAYAASKKIPLHQAFQEMGAKGGDPMMSAYGEYLKSPAAAASPEPYWKFVQTRFGQTTDQPAGPVLSR